MPELPEVATIANYINEATKSFYLSEISSCNNFFTAELSNISEALGAIKQPSVRCTSLGKYLILEQGDDFFYDGNVVAMYFHFGMTGRFVEKSKVTEQPKHAVLKLHFIDRANDSIHYEIYFVDERKFGKFFWTLLENEASPYDYLRGKCNVGMPATWMGMQLLLNYYNNVPINPNDEREAIIKTILSKRKKWGIKKLLMSQDLISGIGNYLASEILWSVKVHPLTKVGKLGDEGIRMVLREAAKICSFMTNAGGMSMKDFVHPDLSEGDAADLLKAYGKQGCKCSRCDSIIEKLTIDGRSTFICPEEQKNE